MKRLTALFLAGLLCLAAAACGAAGTASAGKEAEDAAAKVHKIGVIVYNTGDEEVVGFREYLKGYIEQNFEMVSFVYSGSIRSQEEEEEFIRSACRDGVEGFLSFLSYDLEREVALCREGGAYYLLASGTVSDEQFEAVAEDPYFLGVFGPGKPFEFQAGADMARYFVGEKTGNRYFVLSGGAPLGNEMHYQRTLGVLDTLASAYGVEFPLPREEMARAAEPLTVETEKVTVTLAPGYVAYDEGLASASEAFRAGKYDAALSVLPPEGMAEVFGRTPLGVVDSYNAKNFLLFSNGQLRFVAGKYSSEIGPAFALMLNAVTGYAGDFRDGGRALRVTQGFWTSESAEDYNEKYAFSASATLNAYNFDDLSRVVRLYAPEAGPEDLVALAEACSFRDAKARRGA